ncbi:penicillin-binding transpeptidase domain-containing protein [Acanthopleuribacter pedis]|uniref:Transpeptidase family protein n=1 Tax=Acanthopleuribacter pedis TaxID=442870 RepID=A0A8J7U3H3_9BACT|nr:penicillin-binding transpeptidase domain-containing protein [Acanthopleuribacter pedis]MBO1318749.1 transpeptidase family protein [Acanthopleuribacter pedis]
MKKKDRTFPIRMNILLVCLFAWGAVIVYRLVDLQILRHEEMIQKAENLHLFEESIPARRGEITDARGRILAISQKEPYIFADPKLIEDAEATAAQLAEVLGRDRRWEKKQAAVFANKKRRFSYVAKRTGEAQAQAVRELKLKGVHVRYKSWRTYPGGWLASHVLGFISSDGRTKEGLESQLDDVMRGTPGKRIVMRDGRKQRITLSGEDPVLQEPEDGAGVTLTLDANIQFFVENALRRALKQTRAKNITAIVMDPRDGRILAMANVPDFNPNQFGKYSAFERKNRAVVDVYEPASAFKIVTAAVGLETGRVRLNEVIDCDKKRGGIQVYDKFIRDHKPFGRLTVAEILWHSSNVGSVKIAQRVPEEQFYTYIKKFGFGQETAIDLPAESSGILRPLPRWSKVSSSFLSLGHEISVTPLQMLRAASAVANEGRMVHPYIVERVSYPDGTVVSGRPKAAPIQVITPRTAAKLVTALRGVVTDGTAQAAAIEGVSVFGKTGTAQRLQGSRYSRKSFNASFVGFFPEEQPRYGMMIVVHDPKGRKKHGGEVAAPIFAEIGEQIAAYDKSLSPRTRLPVYVDTPDWMERATIPSVAEGTMPDLNGLGLRNLMYQCGLLGLEVEIDGRGKVVGQWPTAGEPIPEDRRCQVVMGSDVAKVR